MTAAATWPRLIRQWRGFSSSLRPGAGSWRASAGRGHWVRLGCVVMGWGASVGGVGRVKSVEGEVPCKSAVRRVDSGFWKPGCRFRLSDCGVVDGVYSM